MTQSVATLIAARARAVPHAPAILAPGHAPLSYDALGRQMASTAASLGRAGLGRGSRVALALPNGPQAAVALLSTMSCATCVPLNPHADTATLRNVLQRTRADALVVADETAHVAAVATQIGVRVGRLVPDSDGHALDFDDEASAVVVEEPLPEDIPLVLHTSGTTGIPKIVPLTHRSQAAEAQHRVSWWQIAPSDCALCVAPIFTASALRRTVFPLLVAGGRVVCPPSFDGDQLYDWLSEFEPTLYAATPLVHKSLLEAIVRRGRRPAHRLRYIISGTTALERHLQEQFEDALGVPVIQTYAMTETGGIAQNPLPPGVRRPGSVGIASQGEIAIVDGDRAVPPGDVGEVLVRGPQVFAGYEGDPQANREAFVGDWFRTGDAGRLDHDGYLYLTGRLKEIVNRGGFKVSPTEVDGALGRHPAVAEVATCGVPHASLGEDIVAAVIPRDGADVTAQELRDFAFASLADYKVPTRIVLVDVIPRTPLGKVLRRELAAMLAEDVRPAFVSPHNDRERAIARTFAEVLGIGEIGRTDNFFALGGDSLRGVQVAARVNALFGCHIGVGTLFRRPTVAELSDEIGAQSAGGSPTAPPIVPLLRRHAP